MKSTSRVVACLYIFADMLALGIIFLLAIPAMLGSGNEVLGGLTSLFVPKSDGARTITGLVTAGVTVLVLGLLVLNMICWRALLAERSWAWWALVMTYTLVIGAYLFVSALCWNIDDVKRIMIRASVYMLIPAIPLITLLSDQPSGKRRSSSTRRRRRKSTTSSRSSRSSRSTKTRRRRRRSDYDW
jgi:type VI protein secretion system component VasK